MHHRPGGIVAPPGKGDIGKQGVILYFAKCNMRVVHTAHGLWYQRDAATCPDHAERRGDLGSLNKSCWGEPRAQTGADDELIQAGSDFTRKHNQCFVHQLR